MMQVDAVGDKGTLVAQDTREHDPGHVGEWQRDNPDGDNRRQSAARALCQVDGQPNERKAEHHAARIAHEYARMGLPRQSQVEEQKSSNGAHHQHRDQKGDVLTTQARRYGEPCQCR